MAHLNGPPAGENVTAGTRSRIAAAPPLALCSAAFLPLTMPNDADKPQILMVNDTPENMSVPAGIPREHFQIKFAVSRARTLRPAPSTDAAPENALMPECLPAAMNRPR